MKIVTILAAGAATLGIAAPAAAQTYYPQQQVYAYPQQQVYAYPQQQVYAYPQQQGYAYPQQQVYAYPGQQGYAQQNPVASIINQLLGNNTRYTVTDRTAVTQCATAAQAQAAAQYRSNAYGQQPYGNAYGYRNNAYATPRVTGITNVERRNNGLRVRGTMSSGMAMQGYANRGYNSPAYAQAVNDLSFRCNVDYRGAVTNVRIARNTTYRR